MAISRDWSKFNKDCLEKITEKLPTISDYHHFRLVCTDWAKVPLHHLIVPPQLMLAKPQDQTFYFYNLIEGNHNWSKNVREASRPFRICGSSHGWIILINETGEISCLNPNSTPPARVILPPLSEFPNVAHFNNFVNGDDEYYKITNGYGITYKFYPTEMRDKYIKKIILSKSPANEADYIALAIVHCGCRLFYCKKNDLQWCSIPYADRCTEDVVYSNGLFYGLHREGKLAICNLNSNSPSVVLEEARIPGVQQADAKIRHYLVSSKDDDELFIVSRLLNDELRKTLGFLVCKRQQNNHTSWVSQRNLNGKIFFLGLNSSFSLPASDFRGCRGNIIYFLDDYIKDDYNIATVYDDMGKFRLNDGRIEILRLPMNTNSLHCYSPPLWFTPNQ